MASPNTTFKLSEEDQALLERLAAEIGCSRTQVLRFALAHLDELAHERRAKARAFIEQLFHRVPPGSTLMVGLGNDFEPYLTIDGKDRLEDISLIGRRVRSGKDEFVQVFLVEPESNVRVKVGAIQADTGGWLAILEPLRLSIAWSMVNDPAAK